MGLNIANVMLQMMNSELKVESTFGMGSKKDGLNIDTPVVVLTANAIKGVKEEYSEIGFDDVCFKPTTQQELISTLIKWTS